MNSILSPLYWVVTQIIILFHELYSFVFDEDSGWAWGLSIVSLVIVIRIALIPLFVRQIKATRNLQALQPRMKKIQERYKNDRQRQSEEMMKLYRETGTNPLSSCLPILAQSPFFIALFQVLNHIANNDEVGALSAEQVDSAREATVFGAPIATRFMDSASEIAALGASLTQVRVVTVIMIVLMSASQFFTQRQLMTKNVDLSVKTPFMNQQKMLMYVFPIMFAVFGINFPVGVLIYWLTTNIWSMGQQMFVIQRNPTPGSIAYRNRQERLRKKGKLTEEPAKADLKKQGDAARPVRTQPKRQTKAQRQSGGAQAGGQGTAASQAEEESAEETGGGGAAPAAKESAPRPQRQQPQRQQGKKQQQKKAQPGKPRSSAKTKK
ncbi:membrane protein insertase YidC [Streptomyces sp. DSM 44917]|uniref:Membrane protein insertase YidC n=1 Tax=Streptomyces boetiae TaxID=3075541 RepID=A0ABU2L653_9ACTN|nr:membrane protein insertase YidC [Streptomyces sp. DSM 44917]MDT0307038.1 membrane protein insertase YidC [Streptomyces sp. DSM 44917]